MSERGRKKDEGGGKGIVGAAKEMLKKDLEKRRRFLPAGKDHKKKGAMSIIDQLKWQMMNAKAKHPKAPKANVDVDEVQEPETPEVPLVAEVSPVAVTLYTFKQVYTALNQALEDFPEKMNKKCMAKVVKLPIKAPKEREPQPAETYKPTKEEQERGVFFYCYGKKPTGPAVPQSFKGVVSPLSRTLNLEDKFTAEAAKKYLAANGNLAIVPVLGDGACQFRSFWEQLQFEDDTTGMGAMAFKQQPGFNSAHQFTPYRLRLFVVMKMLNMAIYDDDYYEDLCRNITGNYGTKSNTHSGPFTVYGYMLWMCSPDTWGDVITLDMLSIVWQVKVFVLVAAGHSLSELRFRTDKETIDQADFVLVYNGSTHYNAALRETNTKYIKTKQLTSVPGFDRNDFGMDPDPDIQLDLREEARENWEKNNAKKIKAAKKESKEKIDELSKKLKEALDRLQEVEKKQDDSGNQALERENSKLKQQLEEKDKELAKRREKEKKGGDDEEEEGSEGAGSSESEGGDGEDDDDDDDRGAGRKKKKQRKPTRVEEQLSQLTDTVSSLATVMKTIVPKAYKPRKFNRDGDVMYKKKDTDCQECGKSFTTHAALLKHHDRVHRRKETGHMCLEKNADGKTCRKEFASGFNLERHVEQYHRGNAPLVCGINNCPDEFHSMQALKTHQKEQHGPNAGVRNVPCDAPDCPDKFKNRRNMREHFQRCEYNPDRIKIYCDEPNCDFFTYQTKNIKRHNDKHHPKTAESSDGLQEKAKAQRKALAKSRKRKRDLARKARASMREKGEKPVGDSPVSSETEDSEPEPEPAKKKPRQKVKPKSKDRQKKMEEESSQDSDIQVEAELEPLGGEKDEAVGSDGDEVMDSEGYESPPTTKTGKQKMWVKVPRANPKLSGKKKKPKQSDDIREKVLKLKKMGITTVTKDDLDRLSDLEAQEEVIPPTPRKNLTKAQAEKLVERMTKTEQKTLSDLMKEKRKEEGELSSGQEEEEPEAEEEEEVLQQPKKKAARKGRKRR